MYPEAPRQHIVDELFGHQVADPYRWLEEPASAETVAWGRAQDAIARPWLDGLGGRERLHHRLAELTSVGAVSPPRVRGDRAFFTRRVAGQQHAVLVVREGDGSERTLLDPTTMSDDDSVTLDDWMPSIEGDRLAYWTSEGGDEEWSLRILDVATRDVIDGPIGRTRYCGAAFLPGGDEVVYGRRLPAGEVPAGEGSFHRRVWRHKVGAPIDQDQLLFGDGREKTEYHEVHITPDGRWLTISASAGTAPRNDLYLIDLVDVDAAAVSIQEGVDAQTSVEIDDDTVYFLTNLGAPKFRVLAAPVTAPHVDQARELVAESDAVLTGFVVTDDALVVASMRHAVGRVHVHDLATGELRCEVPLPGTGSLTGLTARTGGGDDVWIGYTDFVTPPEVHHLAAGAAALELWAAPPGGLDVSDLTSEQVTYQSSDGTDLTMFLVYRRGLDRSEVHPTILYGYGGFNIAEAPAYSASALAWAEAGGVYAIANIRGGSEEGEEWHRAGMRERKQNTFDDFIAAGEWLIDRGYTSNDHLGIFGGSNGGLLVGAALTQRPDLFAAVVCWAPLLDMVRYEQFGLGATWNDEYGTAADETELGWLLGYSPYHHVVEGTRYPSVLFTVFESDTRVDPMHVRKMAAALQHATSAPFEDRPIAVRRELKVGHGARSVNRTVDLYTDILAFMADRLGLALA